MLNPIPDSSLSAHPVARWLLILIIAAGVYFFHGFLVPVLAALIIGFASWPLFEKQVVRCGGRTWIAASIAIVLILILIITPLLMVAIYLFNEVQGWGEWIAHANRFGAATPDWVIRLPVIGERLADLWHIQIGQPNQIGALAQTFGVGQAANISRWVVTASSTLFSVTLSLLFMLITLFFIYKDGQKLANQLDIVGERILPLRWQRVSRVVPTMVSATVTGMVVIAFGEGIVLGLAYWIAGAPSPITLGLLTGLMALIPGGAPLSMSLVSLYLVGSGKPVHGMLLFAWGAIELFIVDKTIRPRLVGGPVKLPFLPTLFGLIGGVTTMGFVGLFVGPVLMALLVAIWREWLNDEQHHTPTSL